MGGLIQVVVIMAALTAQIESESDEKKSEITVLSILSFENID
jgi:hypothetical protein